MLKKMYDIFGKNKHEIVCYDGPYNVDDTMRGWWFLPSKDLINKTHKYNMLELSIPQRDFDLVVGFSQGAVAATILLDKGIITTKYVVLISGSGIMDPYYIPRSILNVKALGIVGDTDTLCSIDDLNSLLVHYEDSNIVHHKYGHVIPTHKVIKEAIMSLIS
jgi:hypothetical protein